VFDQLCCPLDYFIKLKFAILEVTLLRHGVKVCHSYELLTIQSEYINAYKQVAYIFSKHMFILTFISRKSKS